MSSLSPEEQQRRATAQAAQSSSATTGSQPITTTGSQPITAATASSSTRNPAASPARMTGAEFDRRKRNAIADVAQVSAAQLGPAEQAELVRANAVTREVKAEETSQGQLDKMLSSDSAVMKRAEAQGLQREIGRAHV